MLEHYILQGKTIKRADLLTWATWMQSADRAIGKTDVGHYHVSTVFLGLDHNFAGGRPILFETMVFKEGDAVYQKRASTYDEAKEMHDNIVTMVGLPAWENFLKSHQR